MTDPSLDHIPPAATPGDRPPRRLLERAPGERYTSAGAAGRRGAPTGGRDAPTAGPTAATSVPIGSMARAIVLGSVAAAFGSALHLATATVLSWPAGLLVVAATLGFVVGLALRVGGRQAVGPARRRITAVVVALAALSIAVAVDWALSGRYLGPLDYLAQVYGLLVPVQAIFATAGALVGSR